MGRKKAIEMQELMKATEEVLLEYGYHAFHFKMLADRLDVARTTIYEYYPNKEELIIDYMLNLMDRILTECNHLPAEDDPLQKLKGILRIFVKYEQIHKIIIIIPQLHGCASQKTKDSLARLGMHHQQLLEILFTWIRKGKEENLIRGDVPDGIIAGLFFNIIQIPNHRNIPVDEYVEQLFDVLCHGFTN
jgi:AcrR family transcriptional regulator